MIDVFLGLSHASIPVWP